MKDNLMTWCQFNNLALNSNKENKLLLIYENKWLNTTFGLIDRAAMEMVNSFGFLGFHIKTNLSWSLRNDKEGDPSMCSGGGSKRLPGCAAELNAAGDRIGTSSEPGTGASLAHRHQGPSVLMPAGGPVQKPPSSAWRV